MYRSLWVSLVSVQSFSYDLNAHPTTLGRFISSKRDNLIKKGEPRGLLFVRFVHLLDESQLPCNSSICPMAH